MPGAHRVRLIRSEQLWVPTCSMQISENARTATIGTSHRVALSEPTLASCSWYIMQAGVKSEPEVQSRGVVQNCATRTGASAFPPHWTRPSVIGTPRGSGLSPVAEDDGAFRGLLMCVESLQIYIVSWTRRRGSRTRKKEPPPASQGFPVSCWDFDSGLF